MIQIKKCLEEIAGNRLEQTNKLISEYHEKTEEKVEKQFLKLNLEKNEILYDID